MFKFFKIVLLLLIVAYVLLMEVYVNIFLRDKGEERCIDGKYHLTSYCECYIDVMLQDRHKILFNIILHYDNKAKQRELEKRYEAKAKQCDIYLPKTDQFLKGLMELKSIFD